MDQLNLGREVVERVLCGLAAEGYSYGQLTDQVVFDRERDHYLLITQGWDGPRRVHHVLVHLQLIEGKIWVQQDGTERGVALDLIDAGIPKDRIVLGFKSPELRQHTGFAVA